MTCDRSILACAAIVVAACGGAPRPARAPAEAPPSPLVELTAIRDRACACADPACGEAAAQDLEAWLRDHADAAGDGAAEDQADDLVDEADECSGAAAAPTSELRPVPTDPPATGLARCDEYVLAVRAWLTCDRMPVAAKVNAQDGLDAMSRGWSDVGRLSGEELGQLEQACTQAVEGLHQGLDALGCAY